MQIKHRFLLTGEIERGEVHRRNSERSEDDCLTMEIARRSLYNGGMQTLLDFDDGAGGGDDDVSRRLVVAFRSQRGYFGILSLMN